MTPETAFTLQHSSLHHDFVLKLSSANTKSRCVFLLAHYTARTGSNYVMLSIKQTWQPVSQIPYQVLQELLSCCCQYPWVDAEPITKKPCLLWMNDFSANWNEFNLKQLLLHDVTDKTPKTVLYIRQQRNSAGLFSKWQHKQWVVTLCISATWVWAKVLF